MTCQCYKIGGPFIAEDPDCAEHGYQAIARNEEIEKLREDAERYRWIRSQAELQDMEALQREGFIEYIFPTCLALSWNESRKPRTLDEVIDEMRS